MPLMKFWKPAHISPVGRAKVSVLTKVFSLKESQAKAVIFFILVAGLGLAQLAYTRKKEVQQ